MSAALHDDTARGPATLDEIFRINARRHPDATALADPPNCDALTGRQPQTLSYAQADRAVGALAQRLRELGLPPGCVIALQLPNTSESVIALLAVLRAGLSAALLPLLWRRAECVRALAQIGARALIVQARVGATDFAATALHVGADTFSIRYVCGFGAGLPDGMVPFDDVLTGTAPTALDLGGAPDAERTAIITFDIDAGGLRPVRRTHGELLAGGLAVLMEAALPPRCAIAGAMLLSSFPVLATTFVPWLITGGALHLHHPFDEAVLAEQLALANCDAIVLPGPLAHTIVAGGILNDAPTRAIAVWRSPERRPVGVTSGAPSTIVDVLAFGEIGLVPLLRDPAGMPRPLRIGPLRVPSGAENGTLVITLGASADGRLTLGGPMVAKHLMAAGEHADDARRIAGVDTGYTCRADAATGALTLGPGPAGIVSIGGYRFALRELRDIVGRLDPDSLLAALPDLLAGEKLAGLAADPAAMRAKLLAFGVSPLILDAFRDPPVAAQSPAA